MEANLNATLATQRNVGARTIAYRVVGDLEADRNWLKSLSEHMLRYAAMLAKEINAAAVLVQSDAIKNDDGLRHSLASLHVSTILVSRFQDAANPVKLPHCEWIKLPEVHLTRTGQVKVALLVALAKGLIERGDRVVCLTGIDGSSVIDTCMVLDLGSEAELFSAENGVDLGGDVSPAVFERTLAIASQLAVEGREGRPVGAIFVVGDSDAVIAQSRLLVLNPFHGYPESDRNILDPRVKDTVKEFAAIDGAFIVRGDGVVLTAGSQLLPTAPPPQLGNGLGTRHAAAAAITASTDALSIVVSQSSGTVRVFKSGEMITEIHKRPN